MRWGSFAAEFAELTDFSRIWRNLPRQQGRFSQDRLTAYKGAGLANEAGL
jgi:hypothetical protein